MKSVLFPVTGNNSDNKNVKSKLKFSIAHKFVLILLIIKYNIWNIPFGNV